MKCMIKIAAAAGLLCAASAHADAWLTDTVKAVQIINGNGCIYLTSSGQFVLVDATTDGGRAEYAIAMTALATGKTVKVYQESTSLPQVGGCDSGTTIYQHNMFQITN